MKFFEEIFNKRKIPHLILWVFLFFLIIGFIWAYFSEIDEVTNANGKVIPSTKVQVIQNLEGGIVKKIFVKEGDSVKKGQTLMQLSEVQFSSDYGVNVKNRLALEVKIERLLAQTQGKPFKPSKKYVDSVPNIVKTEELLYHSKINELRLLKKREMLLKKEIRMTKPLLKSGAVSEVEVLRLEQSLTEVEGKIHSFKSGALDELNKAQDDYNELVAESEKYQDRLTRTTIKSPVAGIIKQIYVNTVGGVVKAGVPIMEIVPLEDTLRIEVRVDPRDIGFIRVGMSANVKLTAYDYSIYGGLKGTVEHISADTSQDEDGRSYYEVWIRTDKAYLEKDGKKLQIIPGMQASVSILTGKKTVLDYLLKPVLKAKEKALKER